MASPLDPFHWGVDNVVQALCEPSSPWTKAPEQLAATIREEEIDGKTLLTFEETCPKPLIVEILAIRLARHKASFYENLINLRAKSPAYRSWHRDFSKKRKFEEADDDDISLTGERIRDGNHDIPNGESPSKSSNDLGTIVSEGGVNGPAQSSDKSKGETAQEPSLRKLEHDQNKQSSERPAKRKRVQPSNIAPLPPRQEARWAPWERQPPWAYLGDGALSIAQVKSADSLISSPLVNQRDGSFSIVPKRIPPGRRLAVHKISKNLFRHNSRKEAKARVGEVSIRSPTLSHEDDEILELSDLDADWESDELREIEEEEREREAEYMAQHYLSSDEVRTLLDSEIEKMTSLWKAKKQDKLSRLAHKIWTAAGRKGHSRNHEIIEARKKLDSYHSRFLTIYARILSEKWEKADEVGMQALCLEQTLEDKLKQIWHINILESRTEPPKPPYGPRIPKESWHPFDPMNEILTSSDEEYFIDDDGEYFMTPTMVKAKKKLESYALTTPSRPDLEIDLTQESSEPPRSSTQHGRNRHVAPLREVIDLTLPTPTKPKGILANTPSTPTRRSKPVKGEPVSVEEDKSHKSSFALPDSPSSLLVPRAEDLESWEGLSKEAVTQRQDRWLLTLWMLGKLSFGRRSGILKLIKASSPGDIWTSSIITFLSKPNQGFDQVSESEEETIGFDLARIFYSFLKIRIYREEQMAKLSNSSKARIRGQEKWFAKFLEFIREVEPLLPQENQVYRADLLDLELAEEDVDEEDDEPSQESPSKPRKPVRKEINLDRAAVDLREREQQRAEDQEARRIKLRAELATSLVPQSRSRLIINETKSDDEGLIYIHEDIGQAIKDHQIDGVRFIWNQIILDPECRQGCLLAHTMGLGKTMQVITFLVAVAESSADPSLRGQIPSDLQSSQTLVLCPPSLVNNWIDEFLKWTPEGSLGELFQLSATDEPSERLLIVDRWAQQGGVLVIGYHMFKNLCKGNEEVEKTLLETPSIVIADEAHTFKNPTGQLSKLASRFETTSRIALTGSPLANNVEEYFCMIDWVAPNFLGPLSEFREVYVRPIQAGLSVESISWEKRKALQMLQALKDTVAAKVNRATIKSSLAQDMPPKSEFVISLPPTDLQKALYKLYIDARSSKLSQSKVFQAVNDLAQICNHPACFQQKIHDVQKSPQEHKSFPHEIIPEALRSIGRTSNLQYEHSLKVQCLIMILDEARRVGDKVLVFSQSLYTLNYLQTVMKLQKRQVCRLDGNTSVGQRQARVTEFNTGNMEVYLISTNAGGVGLNIQGANRVVIFDSRWNPVNDQQAVGRAYRLGQKKHVFVYHLMVAGSFEEAIHSKAVFKTQLASRVVDKKNPVTWGKRNASVTEHLKVKPPKDLSGFQGKDAILDRLVTAPPSRLRITEIVSTDTFEEEDINTNLTAEESRAAATMVRMNRLRRTDPEEYERLKAQQAWDNVPVPPEHAPQRYVAPQQRLPTVHIPGLKYANQPPAATYVNGTHNRVETPVPVPVAGPSPMPVLSPAITHVTTAENLQGSSTGVAAAPRIWQQHDINNNMPSKLPSTAPPPLTGANTFFGQNMQQAMRTHPPRPSTDAPKTPPRTNGSLFNPPVSPAKRKFEQKLKEMVTRLGKHKAGLNRDPDSVAATMTEEVDKVRKEQSRGFLPDNLQWQALADMVDQERFTRAAVAGHLTPNFLANADRKDLQRRVDTLNGLSEEDFRAKIGQAPRQGDPENLQNITRSIPRDKISGRVQKDHEVMRQLADNRRQRRVDPLPSWAYQSISANRGNGSLNRSGSESSQQSNQRR